MADRVIAELVYPGQTNDLQMTVTAEDPHRDGRMFIVPVEVVIPIEKITFVRSPDRNLQSQGRPASATAVDQKEFVFLRPPGTDHRALQPAIPRSKNSLPLHLQHHRPQRQRSHRPRRHGRDLECVVVTDVTVKARNRELFAFFGEGREDSTRPVFGRPAAASFIRSRSCSELNAST